ncbi:hypothetical protein C9994_10775 [Marivirga lumbricoides]|uniref:Uncharacterized protein n=1 Tax=Marivirga lumbricoides TaxID=1046115 RepID=A0A2T4DPA4_9BACT|nr:hypothetical protein C9994_10775 [Marivirga lumbricoides]
MKTYNRSLRVLDHKFVIALIVLFTLLGLSMKLKAQSPVLGSDYAKVTSSMKVKLNDFDYDILVPKVLKADLEGYENIRFNQVVYVTDENPGFYLFLNNRWEKQNVRDLLASIDMNLKMKKPEVEDIIIQVVVNESKQMLDYNGHIAHLYRGFTFEEGGTQLAVSIK